MKVPTLQELAARVIVLEEQIVSLTQLLAEQNEAQESGELEAQHIMFVRRLKEKRR